MAKKYLDLTGLSTFWTKAKAKIPTKVSQLTNDSGYTKNTGTITAVQANGTSVATSGTANIPSATTARYGVTELSTSTTSTSTTLAATPSAVRTAYQNGAWYGTCATTTATAAKVVTCSDFVLQTGSHISVKFTYATTATTPTLNVNSTGARAIYINGAAATSGVWKAGDVKEFVYDGTNWVMTGDSIKLNSSTSSTSTTEAATPSAVKAAYDLANGKQNPLTAGAGINLASNVISALYNSTTPKAILHGVISSDKPVAPTYWIELDDATVLGSGLSKSTDGLVKVGTGVSYVLVLAYWNCNYAKGTRKIAVLNNSINVASSFTLGGDGDNNGGSVVAWTSVTAGATIGLMNATTTQKFLGGSTGMIVVAF